RPSCSANATGTAGVNGDMPLSAQLFASFQSTLKRGERAFDCCTHARSLTLTRAIPGGAIQPFCDPLTATSTPHESVSMSIELMELTPSTTTTHSALRAVCASSRSALVSPIDVSLWVSSTTWALG